jgi:hypothetical protein
VLGYSDTAPADLAFVPGYDGTAPYGVWTVTRIFVDSAWASTADPAARAAPARSAPARWSSTATITPTAPAAVPS